MSTILTRTLPGDHVTPVRAYAALRAQSPGRSSFLFESALPGDRWGRYAILGYRVSSEAIYPGGYDPFEMLRNDLVELTPLEAGAAGPDEPTLDPRPQLGVAESMAAGLARAMVGFIGYDTLHRLHDVDPWPTEEYLCRMMKDATVVVFDSVAQTMTIAGASRGALNRCAWEMTHGPDLAALDALDPDALPEYVEPTLSDEQFTAKAALAGQRIAEGHASELVLARTFRAPLRGADPFDVYRALRVLSPAAHLYFLDFVDSVMAPGLTLLGASPETVLRSDRGASLDALRDAFTAKAPTGAPQASATKIIRDLEAGPRHIYGGAIGYFGPGGTIELAAGRQTVMMRRGYFEVTAGADIGAATDPSDRAQATQNAARAPLAAIRAAQEAQRARELAAQKKAEAEKAAAEKAAAEKAAASGEGER